MRRGGDVGTFNRVFNSHRFGAEVGFAIAIAIAIAVDCVERSTEDIHRMY